MSPEKEAIYRAYYAEWEAAFRVMLGNLIQSDPRADELFKNHIRYARQARDRALECLKDIEGGDHA